MCSLTWQSGSVQYCVGEMLFKWCEFQNIFPHAQWALFGVGVRSNTSCNIHRLANINFVSWTTSHTINLMHTIVRFYFFGVADALRFLTGSAVAAGRGADVEAVAVAVVVVTVADAEGSGDLAAASAASRAWKAEAESVAGGSVLAGAGEERPPPSMAICSAFKSAQLHEGNTAQKC